MSETKVASYIDQGTTTYSVTIESGYWVIFNLDEGTNNIKSARVQRPTPPSNGLDNSFIMGESYTLLPAAASESEIETLATTVDASVIADVPEDITIAYLQAANAIAGDPTPTFSNNDEFLTVATQYLVELQEAGKGIIYKDAVPFQAKFFNAPYVARRGSNFPATTTTTVTVPPFAATPTTAVSTAELITDIPTVPVSSSTTSRPRLVSAPTPLPEGSNKTSKYHQPAESFGGRDFYTVPTSTGARVSFYVIPQTDATAQGNVRIHSIDVKLAGDEQNSYSIARTVSGKPSNVTYDTVNEIPNDVVAAYAEAAVVLENDLRLNGTRLDITQGVRGLLGNLREGYAYAAVPFQLPKQGPVPRSGRDSSPIFERPPISRPIN